MFHEQEQNHVRYCCRNASGCQYEDFRNFFEEVCCTGVLPNFRFIEVSCYLALLLYCSHSFLRCGASSFFYFTWSFMKEDELNKSPEMSTRAFTVIVSRNCTSPGLRPSSEEMDVSSMFNQQLYRASVGKVARARI